jgi:hypothetical protein
MAYGYQTPGSEYYLNREAPVMPTDPQQVNPLQQYLQSGILGLPGRSLDQPTTSPQNPWVQQQQGQDYRSLTGNQPDRPMFPVAAYQGAEAQQGRPPSPPGLAGILNQTIAQRAQAPSLQDRIAAAQQQIQDRFAAANPGGGGAPTPFAPGGVATAKPDFDSQIPTGAYINTPTASSGAYTGTPGTSSGDTLQRYPWNQWSMSRNIQDLLRSRN